MKGAFIGFLVMLALGAGGSGVARMTLLDGRGHAIPARPPAAALETPPPQSSSPLTLDIASR